MPDVSDADRERANNLALEWCATHRYSGAHLHNELTGLIANVLATVRAEATEASQKADQAIWRAYEDKLAELTEELRRERDIADGFRDTFGKASTDLRAERDAALAQVADLRVKLEEAQAFNVKEAFAEHDRLSALLAQREADLKEGLLQLGIALGQVAALREALVKCEASLTLIARASDTGKVETVVDVALCALWVACDEALTVAKPALTDTAPAALAYATTLKAEGAREEREVCAPLRQAIDAAVPHKWTDSRGGVHWDGKSWIIKLPPGCAMGAHRADPEEG